MLGVQVSAVIFLKFLTVLFLNLCFVSEVSGGCQVLTPCGAQAGCGEGEAHTHHTQMYRAGAPMRVCTPPPSARSEGDQY